MSRVSAPLTLLAVLVAWALAGPLLSVFGEAYREGAWALRILVLMPLTAASVGPCLLALTAAGRVGEGARAAGIGLAALLVLVPAGSLLGLTGAALGAALAFIAWQGALALGLWRRERLWLGVPLAPARP